MFDFKAIMNYKLLFGLFGFLSITAHSQQTQWAIGIGSSGQETCNSLSYSASGDLYAGGIFQMPFDADPGPGVQTLTSSGGDDLYFNKYTADGELVWARRIGNGSNDDWPKVEAVQGGVYLSGSFLGTCDLDPGPGVSNFVSAGSRDVWIARWNDSGVLEWARKFDGSGSDVCYAMTSDENGNLYVGGLFNGTADLDPGPGVNMFTASGSNDVFVIKLDSSGNTLWSRTYGGTISEGISAIEAKGGQVYLAGTFYGAVDFDPGAGVFIMDEVVISGDGYLVNWTPDGNFVWANAIGEAAADGASGVQRQSTGNILVNGYFSGTVDFDSGPGVFELTSPNDPNTPSVYVVNVSPSGQFLWAKMLSGSSFIGMAGIRTDFQDGFWLCGSFGGSFDSNPGAPQALLTATGFQSDYAIHFDVTGNFVWSGIIAGPSFVTCQAMDALGQTVALSGQFAPNANFSISGDPLVLTTDGTSDAYVVQIGADEPCTFAVELTATHVFCAADGGTATAEVSPPGNYSFQWDDVQQQTSSTATGLQQGTYSVVVSDGNCSSTATVDVPLFSSCPTDFNGDGTTGMGDLSLLISALGSNLCAYDLNQDGNVNFSDLSIFISFFGGVCP